jgi:hypothetical protein
MIKIADFVGSLSHCLEAQRELEQCRLHASGDVEYYSYSYVQDVKRAEEHLEQILDAYIDQRVAQKIEQLKTPLKFEQPSPVARLAAMAT